MRPEDVARSLEGAELREPAGEGVGTAPRIVYAHADAYAVPGENDQWSTRNRLILGIDDGGVVERWEIDADELIESSGRSLDADGLRAAVSRLFAEGRGQRSEEPDVYPDAAPSAPSPGPGDPELDL